MRQFVKRLVLIATQLAVAAVAVAPGDGIKW
jgi:hypothetical protein